MNVAPYRLYVTAVLLLWSAILVPAAMAQQRRTISGRVEGEQGPQNQVIELEWSVDSPGIPISVEMVVPENSRCASTVNVSYTQRDTIANVETSVENPTCDASHGAYLLTISIRDANGQRQSLQFEESWERPESGRLVFSRDYPIGENTELLSARIGRPQCTCARTDEVQSQDDPEAPAN